MKMKKILAGVLSLTLALTMLCSCSSGSSKKDKSDKKDKNVEDVDDEDEDDDDSDKSDKKDHGNKGGSDIDPMVAEEEMKQIEEILTSNRYELVDTEYNGKFVDIVNSATYGVLGLTESGDVVKIYSWETELVANIPDATGFLHQLNGSSAVFVETKSGDLKCVIPASEYNGDVVNVPKVENAVYYSSSYDTDFNFSVNCYYLSNGKLCLKIIDCATGEVKADSEIFVDGATTSGYGDKYGVLMNREDGTQCAPFSIRLEEDGKISAFTVSFSANVDTNNIVGYYNSSYVWVNGNNLEWGLYGDHYSVELPEGFDISQIKTYYVYGDSNDRGCFVMKNGDVWKMNSKEAPEINEFFTSINSHVVMMANDYILLDNGYIYTND